MWDWWWTMRVPEGWPSLNLTIQRTIRQLGIPSLRRNWLSRIKGLSWENGKIDDNVVTVREWFRRVSHRLCSWKGLLTKQLRRISVTSSRGGTSWALKTSRFQRMIKIDRRDLLMCSLAISKITRRLWMRRVGQSLDGSLRLRNRTEKSLTRNKKWRRSRTPISSNFLNDSLATYSLIENIDWWREYLREYWLIENLSSMRLKSIDKFW